MAIVGRDLDVSERKVAFQWCSQGSGQSYAVIASGQVIGISTLIDMFMVPFPCTIQSGSVYSLGNSSNPQISLNCVRWAPGATTFAIGISNMVLTVFGTSGVQGLSGLPVSGSTLLNLQMGDIMQVVTSAANTAIGKLMLELVVKKTQDIVAYNNVST
jgi:hypothetical protein